MLSTEGSTIQTFLTSLQETQVYILQMYALISIPLIHQCSMDQEAQNNQDNVSAYVAAFIQNGMLGWVDEWIERACRSRLKKWLNSFLNHQGICPDPPVYGHADEF